MTLGSLYADAESLGGAPISDIPKIGAFGYMAVEKKDTFYFSDFDNGTNKTTDNRSLTILIDGPNGAKHMVVVQSILDIGGKDVLSYYDPTLNEYNTVAADGVSGIYVVGEVGSYIPPFGAGDGSGSESGSDEEEIGSSYEEIGS